MKLTLANY